MFALSLNCIAYSSDAFSHYIIYLLLKYHSSLLHYAFKWFYLFLFHLLSRLCDFIPLFYQPVGYIQYLLISKHFITILLSYDSILHLILQHITVTHKIIIVNMSQEPLLPYVIKSVANLTQLVFAMFHQHLEFSGIQYLVYDL